MELRRAAGGRDSAADRAQCHAAAPAAAHADGILDAAASGLEEMRVLAVDDNSIDRKLIEMLLKTSSFKGIKTSFKVTAVQDGMKALELLGLTGADSPPRQRLEYDLIMTDYCMPEITGYELLRRIKHESSVWKHVPVVIMSSEKKPARVARCMAEGAQEFLIKPVKLADVQRLKGYVQHLKDTRGDMPSSPTACSSKRKSSASASLPPQRLRRTGLGELIVS